MRSNSLNIFLTITCTGFLFFASALTAQEIINGNLVTAGWVEENLKNPDVLIIDASPAVMYKEKHIPGAVGVDFMTYGSEDIPIPAMQQRFQSWGISLGKKIVIYDQGGSIMATKLFHDLYYYGFPENNLFILDGGLFKWLKESRSVSSEATLTKVKGNFQITKINEDARVKLPEFLTATGDKKNYALIEALDAKWHFGEFNFFDRPGHIPNGIMLPSEDFYNSDKTFKSAEEIKRLLDYLDVKSEKQIYTYCGGGISASVPFFYLKFILNFLNVKLYNDSELGWLRDERVLPFWTYDALYLIKEPSWLKAWGGKIMRMYGVSKISMVDIRAEEEFSKGHLPFAINIPSDLLKSNIANPEKLVEILGHSGVNASDEAVVISGAGLTKESALAFVILEKLGQKKVSLFPDAKDTWTKHGFTVLIDTTSADNKKAGNNLSITPTSYPFNLREGVIIDEVKTTEELYPKVFIFSGKTMPNKVPGDIVVHVPYTELINEDGTPEQAKNIWNTLTKAGVPRYAELICFSDDPGEAAITYFILKLMGYPDIKMLII